MGTRANTRIADHHDYIEHYTRWDGFTQEIQQKMESLLVDWDFAIIDLKNKLQQDKKGTLILDEWVANFECALTEYRESPTIEMTSNLLCFLSFSHHHILQHHTNEKRSSYWGEGNPDITAQLIDGNFIYSHGENNNLQPIIDVNKKEISEQFKIARIYEIDNDGKISEDNYVDFKYKNLTESALLKSILQMPILLRDLYTLKKMTEKSMDAAYEEGKLDILTNLLNKMTRFYTPSKKYSNSGKKTNDKIKKYKKRVNDMNEILSNIGRQTPFDLDISSLFTHIAFANPGNVLPITKGERLSEYDISFQIGFLSKRTSIIYCNIPGQTETQLNTLLNTLIIDSKYLINHFNDHHNVDTIADIDFLTLNSDIPFLGLMYEDNIIKLMENQHSIEINNILKSKK